MELLCLGYCGYYAFVWRQHGRQHGSNRIEEAKRMATPQESYRLSRCGAGRAPELGASGCLHGAIIRDAPLPNQCEEAAAGRTEILPAPRQ